MFTTTHQNLVIILILLLLSCNPKKTSRESQENHQLTTPPQSLSQIQKNNGELIERLEVDLHEQILNKEFKQLYEDADTSLTNKIGHQDIELYFKLIEHYYGSLISLKESGTIMTADYKTLDWTGIFSEGDSLELRLILSLYKDDVRLSYIGFLQSPNKKTPQSIENAVAEVVKDLLVERQFQNIYQKCVHQLKAQKSPGEFESYLRSHILTNSELTYDITESKILIFGHGQVGILGRVNILQDNQKVKKLKLVQYWNGTQFRVADIQFSL